MKSKRLTYLQIALLAGVLVVLNLLAGDYFVRADLTENRRYTLSDFSLQTLDDLDAILTVNVYLEGDFPPRVERFSEAVRTLLEEMKAYGGYNIQYQFLNPNEDPELLRYLQQAGARPVPIVYNKPGGERVEQNVFPAAVLRFRGQEEVVNLLEGNCRLAGGRDVICDYARAEEQLEYKLFSRVSRMLPEQRRIVGLLKGHGELSRQEMAPFVEELEKLYDVIDVEIKDGRELPPSKKLLPDSITQGVDGRGIDVLLVAQPTKPFTERQKYEIDQFVMRSGRVLWVYDQQEVDENDFQQELGSTLSLDRSLNLDDMTQHYGFQVEHDMIQDLRSGQKPLMTYYDNRPRIVPMPYTMYPLVQDFGESPVGRNLNAVMLRYAASIDTLAHPYVRHTPLMRTSPASRALSAPVYLNLDTLMNHRPPAQVFRGKGEITTGLLVEGKFPSVFTGRPAPTDALNPRPPKSKFLGKCLFDNKMIVFSDGALLRPTENKSRFQGVMPYDNRKLLMNAVEYLMGESSLTKIRDKELVIHTLDPKKVKQNEGLIRYGNILAPVLLVALAGFLRFYLRKRKNEKFRQPS